MTESRIISERMGSSHAVVEWSDDDSRSPWVAHYRRVGLGLQRRLELKAGQRWRSTRKGRRMERWHTYRLMEQL